MWRNEYVLRTNYAINPTYRVTSGTVVVRTNLCTNPSMNSNNLGHSLWPGTGGAATLAWNNGTDTPRGTAGYGRITWTTAPSSGGGYVSSITSGISPNTTYTFSIFVRPSVTCNIGAQGQWYNSGTATSGIPISGNITCPANVWTRLSVTSTSGTSDNQYQFRAYVSGAALQVGSTLDFDDCLVEQAAAVLPYFDGSSAVPSGYVGTTPAWTGTANASTSTLSGAQAANSPATAYTNAKNFAGWATGQSSYKTVILGVSSGLMQFGSVAAAQAQVHSGEFWSGSLQARYVPGSSVSGTPPDINPNFYSYSSGGSSVGYVSNGTSTTLPSDGSWITLPVVSTIPVQVAADGGTARWYITTTPQPGSIVEFRNFITEKVSATGTIAGPYFDGASTDVTNNLSYRWTGAADLSAAQQYLAQMVGPPQGLAAYSTSREHWMCDFYDLTNYAFGITKIENSTPEVRGDFTTIPQSNGVEGSYNRSYDAGEFSLSMWVVGCDQDGSIPSRSNATQRAYFERNLSMLIKLLGAQNGPVTLSKIRYAPSSDIEPATNEIITTRAVSTGSTSIDTMMGRQRAEVVFTFTLIDSFWNSTTNTAIGNSSNSYTASLKSMGDAPVDDSVITITGPAASPTVTCSESGVSFTYNGNLTTGQTLVVDSSNWTARVGGVTSVIQKMSHTGHARFMYIPPRDVISVSLNPTVNFYPKIVLSGGGLTAASSVSVSYITKYQVA